MVALIVILGCGVLLYFATGDPLTTALGMTVVAVLLISWIIEADSDDVKGAHATRTPRT
jgi:hypothetical protein